MRYFLNTKFNEIYCFDSQANTVLCDLNNSAFAQKTVLAVNDDFTEVSSVLSHCNAGIAMYLT